MDLTTLPGLFGAAPFTLFFHEKLVSPPSVKISHTVYFKTYPDGTHYFFPKTSDGISQPYLNSGNGPKPYPLYTSQPFTNKNVKGENFKQLNGLKRYLLGLLFYDEETREVGEYYWSHAEPTIARSGRIEDHEFESSDVFDCRTTLPLPITMYGMSNSTLLFGTKYQLIEYNLITINLSTPIKTEHKVIIVPLEVKSKRTILFNGFAVISPYIVYNYSPRVWIEPFNIYDGIGNRSIFKIKYENYEIDQTCFPIRKDAICLTLIECQLWSESNHKFPTYWSDDGDYVIYPLYHWVNNGLPELLYDRVIKQTETMFDVHPPLICVFSKPRAHTNIVLDEYHEKRKTPPSYSLEYIPSIPQTDDFNEMPIIITPFLKIYHLINVDVVDVKKTVSHINFESYIAIIIEYKTLYLTIDRFNTANCLDLLYYFKLKGLKQMETTLLPKTYAVFTNHPDLGIDITVKNNNKPFDYLIQLFLNPIC